MWKVEFYDWSTGQVLKRWTLCSDTYIEAEAKAKAAIDNLLDVNGVLFGTTVDLKRAVYLRGNRIGDVMITPV